MLDQYSSIVVLGLCNILVLEYSGNLVLQLLSLLIHPCRLMCLTLWEFWVLLMFVNDPTQPSPPLWDLPYDQAVCNTR